MACTGEGVERVDKCVCRADKKTARVKMMMGVKCKRERMEFLAQDKKCRRLFIHLERIVHIAAARGEPRTHRGT